ncbi:hypothetical protein [Ruminococcus sp.]|uniref:hypothetical protein n=1 Tax=Ruminococcus sp. TaxID=41978 RepID=UPI0025DEA1A5|nr:hypothetical protein [Ruminococcus sp.]MBR1432443.1 hypothetical protein [Ruminococcus sp.]
MKEKSKKNGREIIIVVTLLINLIYIIIYLSSKPFREVDQYYLAEVIIMLLPSVFSILSLLLLNIGSLPRGLCITAWCMVGYCYLDLNVPFYGGKIYVGANNYAPTYDEHRIFKMILLCICVFALLLNYIIAKRKLCELKIYDKDSYKTKLITAICFEATYTLLFLWRNADHILFFLGKAVTEILSVSSILVIPPLITVLTATFIIIKKKQRVELIYVLLAAGAVSNPIAISIYVYSEYYLYYFGYSVYSLLHFTGILLALSGVLEYESNNER